MRTLGYLRGESSMQPRRARLAGFGQATGCDSYGNGTPVPGTEALCLYLTQLNNYRNMAKNPDTCPISGPQLTAAGSPGQACINQLNKAIALGGGLDYYYNQIPTSDQGQIDQANTMKAAAYADINYYISLGAKAMSQSVATGAASQQVETAAIVAGADPNKTADFNLQASQSVSDATGSCTAWTTPNPTPSQAGSSGACILGIYSDLRNASDTKLASWFILNYPLQDGLAQYALTDAERLRFQTALTIDSLLSLLNTTVTRWNDAALQKGKTVANNHPDFLIPTIQNAIASVPTIQLQDFYNQQLTALSSQWQSITPEQRDAGVKVLKQDIADAEAAAKAANDAAGPCAIERTGASIQMAANNTVGYALSLDKVSNTVSDAITSFYSNFSFLPDSYTKSCHPPLWPFYLVIGLVVAAATTLVFKSTLKVVTFGALKKKKAKK